MYHVCNSSHLVDGIKHDYRLRCVRHTDCNSFPFLNSDSCQGSGALVNFPDKILVFNLAAHKIIGYVIRIVDCNLCNLVVHGALKIFQMGRYSAKIFYPRCFYA